MPVASTRGCIAFDDPQILPPALYPAQSALYPAQRSGGAVGPNGVSCSAPLPSCSRAGTEGMSRERCAMGGAWPERERPSSVQRPVTGPTVQPGSDNF